MNFTPGQRWRQLRDHGNPPLHLQAGAIGSVREVVPADVLGAHDDREGSVVLEFPAHELAYDEKGKPQVVESSRAAAFAIDQFDEANRDHLFEEVVE